MVVRFAAQDTISAVCTQLTSGHLPPARAAAVVAVVVAVVVVGLQQYLLRHALGIAC